MVECRSGRDEAGLQMKQVAARANMPSNPDPGQRVD